MNIRIASNSVMLIGEACIKICCRFVSSNIVIISRLVVVHTPGTNSFMCVSSMPAARGDGV